MLTVPVSALGRAQKSRPPAAAPDPNITALLSHDAQSSYTDPFLRLALLLGDPSGIGPEIVARILAEKSDPDKTTASFNGVNIIVVGEPWILDWGAQCAGLSLELPQYNTPEDLPPSPPGPVLLTGPAFPQEEHTPGRMNPAAGRYVLQSLDFAADLARTGLIDGITYASLNKQAMHAAGSRHEDELRYFADRLGVSGHVGEVNTLDGLYTSRVTSHIPLRAVYKHISVAEILPAIRLIHHTIRRSGLPSPRLAVAGLNPTPAKAASSAAKRSMSSVPPSKPPRKRTSPPPAPTRPTPSSCAPAAASSTASSPCITTRARSP